MRFMKFGGAMLIGSVLATPAAAVPFEEIRIGDLDGFGYGNAAGFNAANGGAANIGAGGPLQTGDFLPDLNNNGVLATGQGDDFDNRSTAEAGGSSVTGTVGGFTDTGTTGSDYTDISLSTSYDTSSAANQVYNANTGTFGAGGAFPGDGNPNTLSNQPGFQFRFDVAKGDIDPLGDVFFNMVFGDYDVTPATVNIGINNGAGGLGSTQNVAVTTQGGGQDGLIQAAFVTLDFSDVFSDGGAVWNGFLNVDFNAPNEPYTAFDYVELSVDPIDLNPMPEPATLGLFGAGLLGVGLAARRRRNTH